MSRPTPPKYEGAKNLNEQRTYAIGHVDGFYGYKRATKGDAVKYPTAYNAGYELGVKDRV